MSNSQNRLHWKKEQCLDLDNTNQPATHTARVMLLYVVWFRNYRAFSRHWSFFFSLLFGTRRQTSPDSPKISSLSFLFTRARSEATKSVVFINACVYTLTITVLHPQKISIRSLSWTTCVCSKLVCVFVSVCGLCARFASKFFILTFFSLLLKLNHIFMAQS